MDLDAIESMFVNAARSFERQPRRLDFVWHGGEPLLAGVDFYKGVFEHQRRIFEAAGVTFTNSVQTNLTVLRPDVLELLPEFSEVGVSVDLFGGNRVNRRGVDSQPRVLEAMQLLIDSGISFGCISVLS